MEEIIRIRDYEEAIELLRKIKKDLTALGVAMDVEFEIDKAIQSLRHKIHNLLIELYEDNKLRLRRTPEGSFTIIIEREDQK